jgi:hypothetical protein
MPQREEKTVYEVEVQGAESSAQGFEDLAASVGGLKDQLAALKEEPLTLGVEGEVPKPPRKKEEEEDGAQRASKKRKRQEDKEAEERFSAMVSSGLVRGFRSRDVTKELAELGQQLAATAATTLLSKGIGAALSAIPGLGMITSFIPGIGPLLSGLLGGLNFQTEGLVRSPTLALVAERDYGYLIAIC